MYGLWLRRKGAESGEIGRLVMMKEMPRCVQAKEGCSWLQDRWGMRRSRISAGAGSCGYDVPGQV